MNHFSASCERWLRVGHLADFKLPLFLQEFLRSEAHAVVRVCRICRAYLPTITPHIYGQLSIKAACDNWPLHRSDWPGFLSRQNHHCYYQFRYGKLIIDSVNPLFGDEISSHIYWSFFLAVQDSSITDIVCLSLGRSVGRSQLTIRAKGASKSDTRH